MLMYRVWWWCSMWSWAKPRNSQPRLRLSKLQRQPPLITPSYTFDCIASYWNVLELHWPRTYCPGSWQLGFTILETPSRQWIGGIHVQWNLQQRTSRLHKMNASPKFHVYAHDGCLCLHTTKTLTSSRSCALASSCTVVERCPRRHHDHKLHTSFRYWQTVVLL